MCYKKAFARREFEWIGRPAPCRKTNPGSGLGRILITMSRCHWITRCCAIAALALAATARSEVGPLQLVGEARLQVLFWSIYDSRLYTADGDYQSGERPVRLEIQYLRSVSASDLVARTSLEWEQLGLQHERQSDWLATLASLWPDIRENDTLALELDQNNRTTFYYNGQSLGRIDDPDFGRHFLAIWLSPETSRPELRLALLGDS
jgi:hypothetical protein